MRYDVHFNQKWLYLHKELPSSSEMCTGQSRKSALRWYKRLLHKLMDLCFPPEVNELALRHSFVIQATLCVRNKLQIC